MEFCKLTLALNLIGLAIAIVALAGVIFEYTERSRQCENIRNEARISNQSFVTISGEQTLYNKTLIEPKITNKSTILKNWQRTPSSTSPNVELSIAVHRMKEKIYCAKRIEIIRSIIILFFLFLVAFAMYIA